MGKDCGHGTKRYNRVLDAQLEGARHWAENAYDSQGVTTQETAEWAEARAGTHYPLGRKPRSSCGDWFEFVKKLDVSNMTNWGRDGQKFVQSCQETIQKALESQTEWVRLLGRRARNHRSNVSIKQVAGFIGLGGRRALD